MSPFKSCLIALTAVAAWACHSAPASQHDLIAAAIISDIAQLPESLRRGEYESLGANTADSAQKLYSAMWASWWYTARHNGVVLPAQLRKRFERHLDVKHPPVDPYPEIPDRYAVVGLRVVSDTEVVAEVGVPYQRCTYTFVRAGDQWRVLTDRTTGCWIS